jgi:hypothetical protein
VHYNSRMAQRRAGRYTVCAWAWAIATFVALAVARLTKIGPAIPITSRHGVHAGDLAAFAIAYALAAALTLWTISRERNGLL